MSMGPFCAERGEHGVVEGGTGGDIGALDRKVVEHGVIFFRAPSSTFARRLFCNGGARGSFPG